MFEPLSVGLWATEKADLRPEHRVAILGVGTIGMMTLQSVLAIGATDITVFDVSDFKLEVAKQFGVKVVNSKDSNAFDIVFETSFQYGGTCQGRRENCSGWYANKG